MDTFSPIHLSELSKIFLTPLFLGLAVWILSLPLYWKNTLTLFYLNYAGLPENLSWKLVNCILFWKLPSYYRYSRNLLWIIKSLVVIGLSQIWKSFLKLSRKLCCTSPRLPWIKLNELNEPLQSAYKRFHSCETTLTRNDILLEIDNRHCVIYSCCETTLTRNDILLEIGNRHCVIYSCCLTCLLLLALLTRIFCSKDLTTGSQFVVLLLTGFGRLLQTAHNLP